MTKIHASIVAEEQARLKEKPAEVGATSLAVSQWRLHQVSQIFAAPALPRLAARNRIVRKNQKDRRRLPILTPRATFRRRSPRCRVPMSYALSING
jgi:hypothetical protein